MSQLLKYREKRNLTQEQLSLKANVSVRTIQRIEAGQKLKGHTLTALSEALEISSDQLISEEIKEKEANILLAKLINLSSLLLIFIPLGSIILPLIIMFVKKEFNAITKQMVTIQIIWTLSFPLVMMIVIFLNKLLALSNQIVPFAMILLILANVYIILRNTASLDKNNKLAIHLNFSIL